MGELQEIVQLCLGAFGLVLLGMVLVDVAGDHYDVLVLPGWRVRVFRMWFAPGSEVYHPDLGRCEVARLDRTPDLGMPWVCLHPLDEECEGWVLAAHWVPFTAIGETPEEAEQLNEPDEGGGLW